MGGSKAEDVLIDIKVQYEDEWRLFFSKPGVYLYTLRDDIFRLFRLNGDAQQLEIRFRDEDGDLLTMSNDEDVEHAFKMRVSHLRLWVSWSRRVTNCSKICWGPCGGGGGSYWNDGKFEGITAITVTADSTTLYSIQVTYDTVNANQHEAPRHGGGSGKTICTAFIYPSEKLEKIRGYCGTVCDKRTVIKGLIFETNRATYGPFGVVDWIPFELDLASTKVAGFYGRASGEYLESIALHRVPF